MRYTVILKPAKLPDEPGYIASVPALPGCVTEGDTIEEALANVREAIEGYILSLKDEGLPIPVETELFEAVEVEIGA